MRNDKVLGEHALARAIRDFLSNTERSAGKKILKDKMIYLYIMSLPTRIRVKYTPEMRKANFSSKASYKAIMNKKKPYSRNQGHAGPELKALDTDISALGLDTTGTPLLINGVAQGNDLNNRIGRKFQIKSILIRGNIRAGSTAVSGRSWRFLVIYDKQCNGTALTTAQVLSANNMGGLQNLDNRERFVILADKMKWVGAPNADNTEVNLKLYLKCNLPVTNSGTGATVASIATGSIYVLGCSDVVAGTAAPAPQNLTARIRYKDE